MPTGCGFRNRPTCYQERDTWRLHTHGGCKASSNLVKVLYVKVDMALLQLYHGHGVPRCVFLMSCLILTTVWHNCGEFEYSSLFDKSTFRFTKSDPCGLGPLCAHDLVTTRDELLCKLETFLCCMRLDFEVIIAAIENNKIFYFNTE